MNSDWLALICKCRDIWMMDGDMLMMDLSAEGWELLDVTVMLNEGLMWDLMRWRLGYGGI